MTEREIFEHAVICNNSKRCYLEECDHHNTHKENAGCGFGYCSTVDSECYCGMERRGAIA